MRSHKKLPCVGAAECTIVQPGVSRDHAEVRVAQQRSPNAITVSDVTGQASVVAVTDLQQAHDAANLVCSAVAVKCQDDQVRRGAENFKPESHQLIQRQASKTSAWSFLAVEPV